MKQSKGITVFFAFYLLFFQTAWAAAPNKDLPPLTISNNIQADTQSCIPGQGMMWVTGTLDNEKANEVEEALDLQGFSTSVEARGYGEIDSCGTYSQKGLDFKVTLLTITEQMRGLDTFENNLEIIETIVEANAGENSGNIVILDSTGNRLNGESLQALQTQSLDSDPLPADAIVKDIYVIVYDPLLGNGQTLSQYMHWNNSSTITQQTIDFFQSASNGDLAYNVAFTSTVNSGWPELIDGYTYNETTYLQVIENSSLHHIPSEVNYTKIIDDPAFDICGKVNRGEIDEVWIYNGPWFGFYESRLVGPGAYTFNSPPLSNGNCSKMVPIMGPNVERTIDEAVHNFTHRAEATMSKVYGGWAMNRTSHNWDRFALVKAQSPNYSYSGCGSSHYPPNGVQDYDYSNATNTLSNCEDFFNFPNLSDPLQVLQPVNCTSWGCNGLGYYDYWFSHFPSASGCTDYISNNWWNYFADPSSAVIPSKTCGALIISGNAGVGGAILNYSDEKSRTVVADGFGYYYFPVMSGWSGTLTPFKSNYTFVPISLNYTNINSDLSGQNFIANINNCQDINDWKGEYWGNTTMTGAPLICRNDVAINFPWGSGSPNPSIPADNFSARWTRTMEFAPGLYRFSMSHDDGARLYIDDEIKIDASGTCCVWDQVDLSLTGSHTIRMEMFENSGWAGAHLNITTLSLYQPEIEIRGNNVAIADGSITTSTANHTNFGSIETSEGILTRTFTILNTGQSNLSLNGNPIVEINGVNPDDFAVIAQPESTITPSRSITFSVMFDPSASGVRTATISIANDDPNENPYNFTIRGEGVTSPEINVTGNSLSITSGDNTPSSSDFTDFGNAELESNVVSRTFTIQNAGDSNLNLTNTPYNVSISGNDSSDFILSTPPSSSIAPGGSSTFTITFTPNDIGNRKATLSIANNDTNENPYTFSIQGNGKDTTIFTVNTVADDNDGYCDPFENGVSDCSLREAISMATNGDTITFVPSLAGQTIHLQTELEVFRNLIIDASSLQTPITISGDTDNNGVGDTRLMGITSSVIIKNINFEDGKTTTNSLSGGINNFGILRIYASTFSGNTGTQGGAIRNAGWLEVEDCDFTNNTGSNFEGGAILNNPGATAVIKNSTFTGNSGAGGAIGNLGTLTIEDSQFINNTSTLGGGALVNSFAGATKIYRSTFTGNSTQGNGGAIYNLEGVVEIYQNTFSNNSATQGGAIIAGSLSYGSNTTGSNTTTLISESVISNNQASFGGGGIEFDSGTSMTIDKTTISDNTAPAAGGIANISGNLLTITNSTISNNTATEATNPSGIISLNSPVTIKNSTITGNNYTAISIQGDAIISNTTIAGNPGYGLEVHNFTLSVTNSIIANNGFDCRTQNGASVSVNQNNLIETNNGCGIPALTNDPLLGSLSSNGGLTQTMALLPGSPAIDAGNDAACNAHPVDSIDQRGIPRPQGSHCDIGAYEYQDSISPLVMFITRASSSPTSASSVDFTVSFSEDVTGVSTSAPFEDFALDTTGVSGAAITGVSGSGSVYTVSVNTGSGNGTIRLDVPVSADITDLSGTPLSNLPYTGDESYSINKTLRAILYSTGSQDGWVLESSETSESGGTVDSSSTVLMIGDDASDRQYRSMLSFDTSSLPDTAVITQAVLSLRVNEVLGGGNPIKVFNYFMADMRTGSFGASSALAAQDFGFSPTVAVGPLGALNRGGWYYVDLKTGKSAVNTTGLTQVRLRFSIGDNDNGIANIIKIYSGNSTVKPQLSLWYYVP